MYCVGKTALIETKNQNNNL